MKNWLFRKTSTEKWGMWWNCHSTGNFLLGDCWSIHRQWWFRSQVCKNCLKLPMKLQKHQAYVGAIWRHWIFWTWWQRKRPRLFQFTYRSRWLTKNRSIADEFLKANIQTPWRGNGNGMYFYGKVLFTCCVLRYIEIVHGMPNQQSMQSEKRRIPFAFDRSLLWGSMNYSLTQSGEQKTSSGADWPHAQISMCIWLYMW